MGEPQTCCFIGGWRNRPCKSQAEFMVIFGAAPDEYTFACAVHVGDLLTDAPIQQVVRLDGALGGKPGGSQ